MNENQIRRDARQVIFESLTDQEIQDAFPKYVIWVRVLKSFEWYLLKHEAEIHGNHFEMGRSYHNPLTPAEIKEQSRWFVAHCIFRENRLNESSLTEPIAP